MQTFGLLVFALLHLHSVGHGLGLCSCWCALAGGSLGLGRCTCVRTLKGMEVDHEFQRRTGRPGSEHMQLQVHACVRGAAWALAGAATRSALKGKVLDLGEEDMHESHGVMSLCSCRERPWPWQVQLHDMLQSRQWARRWAAGQRGVVCWCSQGEDLSRSVAGEMECLLTEAACELMCLVCSMWHHQRSHVEVS